MDYLQKLVIAIETHSVEDMRDCFEHGVRPNDSYNNQPLIYELTSEYTRSPRFKDCVRTFVDYGLVFDDILLLAVLLDDAVALDNLLRTDKHSLDWKYTLRVAYTPMDEASLLHICAEFNHVSCAEVLMKHGADVNAKAGYDKHGFGGQTPIFHTVNQNSNASWDMLNFLLDHGADLQYTVRGLTWGRGYEWESFIPAVNPISYAMMGLLPQMHRDEKVIAKVVSLLLKKGYGIDYEPTNVPNAYLKG